MTDDPRAQDPAGGQQPGQGGFDPQQGNPPQQGQGYPPQQGQGYPPQQGQGYPPQQGQGYPPQQGQGYPPQQGQGYPPQQGQGYPPQQGQGYPPQGPGGVPPQAADDGGGGGQRGLIIALALALIVALGIGGYLIANPKSGGAADGEVFLEPASSTGQDPFSTVSFSAPANSSIAQPATSTPPKSTTKAVSATSGGQPGLYGGTQNLVSCDADKMLAFLQANPGKAAAWVKALNSDPSLRWSKGTLKVADIGDYLRQLTPIILVSDTRVTNHGFVNGGPSAFQSVLQKGTGVFVDSYGVPRVRCFCGNPLTAPQAAKKKVTYQGKAWKDFSPVNVTVVTPNGSPLTTISVRVPATPNGQLVTITTGPAACFAKPKGAACTTPSGATTKPSTSPSASASSSPSASPTSAGGKPPISTKKGDIGIAGTNQQGKNKYYYLKFTGYSPNSRVPFTCRDSQKVIYKGYAVMDATGSYTNSDGKVFCFTPNSGFSATDYFGSVVRP